MGLIRHGATRHYSEVKEFLFNHGDLEIKSYTEEVPPIYLYVSLCSYSLSTDRHYSVIKEFLFNHGDLKIKSYTEEVPPIYLYVSLCSPSLSTDRHYSVIKKFLFNHGDLEIKSYTEEVPQFISVFLCVLQACQQTGVTLW